MPETQYWTNEEQTALLHFKERLKDLDLKGNPLFEDRRLINWLRARELKLDDAEAMLRKHLVWRRENNIDTILTSGDPPQEAISIIPADIVGVDKQGNLILVIFAAPIDIQKALAKYGKAMALKVFYFMLETAYADNVAKSQNPKLFKKADYIVDIDGVRFKDYLSADVLDLFITILKDVEANYPELLHKAYILNAPMIFPVLWNILKPFLSPKTIDKVNVLGHNQDKIRSCMLEQIDESQLPRKWGGTGFSEKIPQLNIGISSGNKGESTKDFLEVVIPAGESLDVNFDVEIPKAVISWGFKTKHYDIGFTLLYKEYTDPNRENLKDLQPKEMIGYKRINSQKAVQSGSIVCELRGQYCLRFDNSYSRLREKTLLYRVEMTQVKLNGNDEHE